MFFCCVQLIDCTLVKLRGKRVFFCISTFSVFSNVAPVFNGSNEKAIDRNFLSKKIHAAGRSSKGRNPVTLGVAWQFFRARKTLGTCLRRGDEGKISDYPQLFIEKIRALRRSCEGRNPVTLGGRLAVFFALEKTLGTCLRTGRL